MENVARAQHLLLLLLRFYTPSARQVRTCAWRVQNRFKCDPPACTHFFSVVALSEVGDV
jgi:hypothetical protein